MKYDIEEKKNNDITIIQDTKIGDLIKPLAREIHLFDTYVSGTSYLDDPGVLKEIQVNDKLILQREINKFDESAIVIYTQKKEKLGYIPEKDNVIFARLMDAGKKLSATINDINTSNNYCRIAISIYLIDF